MNNEPLPVGKLTVDQFDTIRREMLCGLLHQRDFDEIDEAAADPIHDRLPAYRSKREASSLDAIFDELERGDHE